MSAFNNLTDITKVDRTSKRKAQLITGKFSTVPLPPMEATVLSTCQHDHFLKVAKHGVFYSLPMETTASLQSLTGFFGGTEAAESKVRRQRLLGAEDGICRDVALYSGSQHGQCFFQLSTKNLGYKKTMKLAPASGRKLQRTDVTITMAKALSLPACEPNAVVVSDDCDAQVAGDGICVLSDVGDPEHAAIEFLEWKVNDAEGLRHTFNIPPEAISLELTEPTLTELASSFGVEQLFRTQRCQ